MDAMRGSGPSGRRDGTAMNRLDLTRRLVSRLTHGEIVVSGIGNASLDLVGTGRRPENFYMLGSMGLAVPIGLGLALAQPQRRVVVLEGDGSLLMSMGSLATVAAVAPSNLVIIAWDNGLYQITGNQPAATSGPTDLVAVARGAGIARGDWARDEDDFARLVERALGEDGPHLIAARVDASPGTGPLERNPGLVKDQFMRGIGIRPAR